jgi:uncharacterized protein
MNFRVRIKPNSRQNEISMVDGIIIVRVKAPPIDGKANRELIAFLSEVLQIPKSKITIAAGAASKFKTVFIPDEYQLKVDKVFSVSKI